MGLNQIYEGWKNHLLPDDYIKEQIISVSEARMKICRECPLNSLNNHNSNPLRFDEHCTECGCTLAPKTKCLSCKCPLDKWTSVITPEEEQNIANNEKGI